MEFRTKVDIPKASFSISHDDKLLLAGSCFTENIGDYLHLSRIKTYINPFGIIYNPYSIFKSLKRIAGTEYYSANDLLKLDELYVSPDHHGSFSGTDKEHVLENINAEIDAANQFFMESNFLVITAGTSFIYTHKERKQIVANCHKIPGSAFEKRLLSIEEIVRSFEEIKNLLKDKKILFTISPVRHWRDGAIENQQSKSILFEAIRQIILKNENCFYFPAYEIVMDELRDYRFYEADMIHPNAIAVQYIWHRFGETYFSEETKAINKRLEAIHLLLQHRVKHTNTKAESDFRRHVQKTIEVFKKDYPGIEPVLFPSDASSKIGNSI